MISTMQAEEIGSNGVAPSGLRLGAAAKPRWIPSTFMVWAWMIVLIEFFARAPWLRPFGAATWVGELLRYSLGCLLVAGILPIYLKRDGLTVRDLGFAKRPLTRDVVQGCAAGLGLHAIATVVFYFLFRGPSINLILSLHPSAGGQGVAKILVIVMLAPVIEELAFRGGLIAPLRVCWGGGLRRDALYALLSGVVFACCHYLGHPLYYAAYVFLGTAFAVLYQRTGSLRTVMIAHAVMNATALAFGAILH